PTIRVASPETRSSFLLQVSPASAAGSLDPQHIARQQAHRHLRRERGAVLQVRSRLPVRPAVHAAGAVTAALREKRRFHFLQRNGLSHPTITTDPLALPPTPPP